LKDQLLGDGKKTITVKEKVPKYAKQKVLVVNPSSGGGILDKAVPKFAYVDQKVKVGEEEVTKTVTVEEGKGTVDTGTFGERLTDGFTKAFADFATIGASFSKEWNDIKNDFGTIGTGIAAGFVAVYEGAKMLLNKAIDGVRGLFATQEPKIARTPLQEPTLNSIKEKGIREWSKKSGLQLKDKKDLEVRIIEQTLLSTKACVFYSRLMTIEEKTGNTIDPDKALDQGIRSGSMKAGYYVKDANKLASENGLQGEVLQPTIYGSNEKITLAILEQIEKGNPVMVLIGDSKGTFNHMEVAKGYEFDNSGNLRILLADPGFQKDKYFDVDTMQPYKIERGIKVYSGIYNEFNIRIEDRRKVYGINYYSKNAKK
jgi:hypothetical protein